MSVSKAASRATLHLSTAICFPTKWSRPLKYLGGFLNYYVEDRDEEYAEYCCYEHPAEDCCSECAAGGGAGTGGHDKRDYTKDK